MHSYIRVADGVVWIEVPLGYGNGHYFDDVYVIWEDDGAGFFYEFTLKNWMVIPL